MSQLSRSLFVFGLLWPMAAGAQSQPPCPSPTPGTYTCLTGTPHFAQFDYDPAFGRVGDVFRLYINAAQVGPDVPWVVGTAVVQIGLPASMPVGSYAIAASTVRATAAPPEAKSAPVTLILTDPPPTAPGLLRIVEVILRQIDQTGKVYETHIPWAVPVQ